MERRSDGARPPRIEPTLGVDAKHPVAHQLRLEDLPDHIDEQKRAASTDRRRARTSGRRAAAVVGVVAFLGVPLAFALFYDMLPSLSKRASRAAQSLLEDAVRARAAMDARPKQAAAPTYEERKARELARKEAAWWKFFNRSPSCAIEANQTSVECVNEYIRARHDFEQRWDAAQL